MDRLYPSEAAVDQAERFLLSALLDAPAVVGLSEVSRGLAQTLPEARDPATGARMRWPLIEARYATYEAAWRLIGLGLAVPTGQIESRDSKSEDLFEEQDRHERHDLAHLEVAAPAGLRLSSSARSWLADGTLSIRSPTLYIEDLTAGLAVKRCLREAVEAYRRGLFVACVILLGVAAEGAWVEVGRRSRDPALIEVVESDRGFVAKMTEVLGRVARKDVRKRTGRYPDWIELFGRIYADLRNYAAHSDLQEVAVDSALAATLLLQMRDYLRAIYALAPQAKRE